MKRESGENPGQTAAVSSAKIFNNTLATVLERMGRAFEDWSKSEDLPK